MNRHSKLTSKRIFGLDFVRSLSVCAVVLAHAGHPNIFGFRYGVIAIEYFFVMSGFLVGEMLIREFHEGSTLKLLFNFWIKRWFRTLPLYYLILIIKIIITKPFVGWEVWPYFLFLQNNVGGITFFQVSWTLVIEEWFYLIMPLLIFVFFKNGIQKNKFIVFSMLVLILEIIFRVIYVNQKDVPWGGIVGSFPFRLDSFMIGVFIAFIKVDYYALFQKLSGKLFFYGLSIALIIYLIIFSESEGGQLSSKVFWTRTIGFTLTSILLALQLPFLTTNKSLNNIPDENIIKKMFTWISLLSYPIYLIHIDVLHFTRNNFGALPAYLQDLISYAIILVLSYLLIIFFHQPVTDSRKKFLLK